MWFQEWLLCLEIKAQRHHFFRLMEKL